MNNPANEEALAELTDDAEATLARHAARKAEQELAKMTRGQLAKKISGEQRELLRKLMGQGPKGAQDALKALQNGAQLPEGLSRETLEIYKMIAKKSIEDGIDKIGTQAARLALLRAILGSP
jgi:hypothetical protein